MQMDTEQTKSEKTKTKRLKKIPATIVTGFLGSGKTTLLSNVIKEASGKRIAVIVNEFGELDIDANLLRSCPLECEEEGEADAEGVNVGDKREEASDGIYELANGCICCTVEEEFLPVMQQLVERRDEIDHILIETSGLALPKPLVQAFNWPEIKQHCTVDAVITLIDGPAVAAGRFADDVEKVEALRRADENLDHDPSLRELLDDQLSAADLVVVSKSDLLDEEASQQVSDIVAKRVPSAVKTLYINHGQFLDHDISLQELLGIEAKTENRIESTHTHHDHHHAHGEEHEHAHDHFDSLIITMGEVRSEQLTKCLLKILGSCTVYRVKGFAALPNKPMRQVVQGVGKRLGLHFDRLWQPDEARQTQLVFIGKQLQRETLESMLAPANYIVDSAAASAIPAVAQSPYIPRGLEIIFRKLFLLDPSVFEGSRGFSAGAPAAASTSTQAATPTVTPTTTPTPAKKAELEEV